MKATNLKSPNALGFLGVSLLGGSLWPIHPAMTIAFAGVVLLALAVWIHRNQTKVTLEQHLASKKGAV